LADIGTALVPSSSSPSSPTDQYPSTSKHSGSTKITYEGLMNRSVHTEDDKDIGDVFAVNAYFIVVVRGFVNVHYYYIPLNKVEGWDGNVLWLNISKVEVKRNYERDVYPDSSRYFIKDDPPYQKFPPDFPEPIRIDSRSKRLTFNKKNGNTTTYNLSIPPGQNNKSTIHICDLCNLTSESPEELKNHVFESH
jgi:hypothetical protein